MAVESLCLTLTSQRTASLSQKQDVLHWCSVSTAYTQDREYICPGNIYGIDHGGGIDDPSEVWNIGFVGEWLHVSSLKTT